MNPYHYTLPLLLLLAITVVQAQPLPGYNSSRYAGIAAVELQPASAANDLYKFDILFIGAETGFNNNYVSFRRRAMYHRSEWYNNDVNFKRNYTKDNYNRKVKHGYIWSKIYLPSILYMPTNRLGLAYNWGSRGAFQVRNAEPDMAKLIYEEMDYEPLWGQPISNPDLTVNAVRWHEHSLSVGYKLVPEGTHRWKAGISVKLIKGINATYLHARSLDLTAHHTTDVEYTNTDFAFGASEDFAPSEFFRQRATGKLSAGFGAGVIYQYNPPSLDIEEKWRPSVKQELERYKFQAGISLVDFGNVIFEHDNRIGDFSTSSTHWNMQNTSFSSVRQFADTLNNYFTMQPNSGQFKIALPAAANLNFDYHVYRYFFVNFNHFQALTSKKSSQSLRAISTVTLTPRYETDALGVYLPLSYSELQNLKAGVAFRVGPLVIGTSDLNNLLVKKYFRSADIFVLLKWGLLWSKKRPRDLCPSDPELM